LFRSTLTEEIDQLRIDLVRVRPIDRMRPVLYDYQPRASIQIPPLRERREDIPLLVRYFVQKFTHRMNKQVGTISPETIEALLNYDWPGNVRQLENFIERSVILTNGSILHVKSMGAPAATSGNTSPKSVL